MWAASNHTRLPSYLHILPGRESKRIYIHLMHAPNSVHTHFIMEWQSLFGPHDCDMHFLEQGWSDEACPARPVGKVPNRGRVESFGTRDGAPPAAFQSDEYLEQPGTPPPQEKQRSSGGSIGGTLGKCGPVHHPIENSYEMNGNWQESAAMHVRSCCASDLMCCNSSQVRP